MNGTHGEGGPSSLAKRARPAEEREDSRNGKPTKASRPNAGAD